MKNVLFLLLFTPAIAFSKGIELSISGGLTMEAIKFNSLNEYEHSSIVGYGDMSVGYNIGKTQIGISGNIYKLIDKLEYTSINGSENSFSKFTLYSPVINSSIFVKRFNEFGKSSIAYGINAGVNYCITEQILYGASHASYFDMGISFGATIGYSYQITKDVSIIASFSPKYNILSGKSVFGKFHYYLFPIMGGIVITI